MGRRVVAALMVGLALGCSKDDKKGDDEKSADDVLEKVDGTASVGGKETKIESCKAVAKNGLGLARIELGTGLVLTLDPAEGVSADHGKLDCSKNKSDWRSGVDGSKAWAKGRLTLECDHPDGALKLDVKFDCGAGSRKSNEKGGW